MGVKVIFDLQGGQIVIDGAESELVSILQQAKAIAPKFEIRIVPKGAMPTASRQESENHSSFASPVLSSGKPSMRDFAKNLHLANTYERIAALAYYVNKIERRSHFTVKEMDNWFGLCGFRKPAIMSVAFSDTKRKYGYLESKARDQWSVSTSGENKIMEKLEH